MNRAVWVVIALFCSPMFTGAAYGGEKTACARLATGFKAPCGAVGTLYASRAANGRALDLLREDYDVVTIDAKFPARFTAAPVVIAAPDLDNPAVTSLLHFAYKAGKTVAIVHATQDEADRFAHFFGASGANCLPASGSTRIALYGLQQSRDREPPMSSSYCLVGLGSLGQSGERTALHWLRQRFAANSPAPTPPNTTNAVSASENIVDLATAIHCSFMNANDPADDGRILTQDAYVTGARSFINSEDIYYVQNELQYTQGDSTNPDYGYQVTRFGATGVLNFRRGLSKTQPSTVTQYQSSFTNETTTTISASVGFDANGPTGTIGGSVTHGESYSYTIPPTIILNNSVNPLPAWEFHRQNTAGKSYDPQTSWFWTVPWSDYADGGSGSSGRLHFNSSLVMGNFVGETTCAVPYPFEGIRVVGEPVITSVEPETVGRGDMFTITGKQLYPGMVNAILLGGTSVGADNFTDNGETAPDSGIFTVDVIVPGSQYLGNNTVVVQQTFNSKARFSNVDHSINVIDGSQ